MTYIQNTDLEYNNSVFSASTNPHTIYPEELYLKNQRAKEWFETFLKYTDEKDITSAIYFNFIKNLVDNNRLSESTILDVGCGDGILSSSITKGFSKATTSLEYHCLEYDFSRIESFKSIMDNNGIKAYATQGSCFSKDLDAMPYDADLIVASHIAYYAVDIPLFIDNLIEHGNKNSILLLNHESSNSVPNMLRKYYNSTVNTEVANGIKEYGIGQEELVFHEAKMKAKIIFPEYIHSLLRHMADDPHSFMEGNALSSLCFNDSSYKGENIHEMKMLLEFAVQRPLETLVNEGLLNAYLSDITTILSANNNTVPVSSELQIISFKDSDYNEQIISYALYEAINNISAL